MLHWLLLAAAMLVVRVESKCVEFSNQIVFTKPITDYTTYYTTLSRGDITMQVKEAPDYYTFFTFVQVIPEDGDITAYRSVAFGAGDKITLAESVPPNMKFRLQVQLTPTGEPKGESNKFAGTLCYPTESATSAPSETTTEVTESPITEAPVADPTSAPGAATTTAPRPTATSAASAESSSSGGSKTATIAASIVGALLGATGLTYLCRKCSVEICSEKHYHKTESPV